MKQIYLFIALFITITIDGQIVEGDGQFVVFIDNNDTFYLIYELDKNTLITNHNSIKLNQLWEVYSSTELFDSIKNLDNDYLLLPRVGEAITKNTYYKHDTIVVLCVKSGKLRGDPCDYPEYFVCPRYETTLVWIINESVDVGYIRILDDIKYVCIKAHKTKDSNKPPDPKYWALN